MAGSENGKVEGLGRADPPSAWRHTSDLTPDVDMTWHHVIPLKCLTTVWNGLVDGEHWDAAERFLHVAGATKSGEFVEKMKEGQIGGEERDRLQEHVTWQGWNIVEGPGGVCRTDDPGDAYERFHWTTLSNNRRSTMIAVTKLNSEMGPLHRQLARQDPQPISSEQAARLSKTFSDNRSALRNKAPIPFTEGMWEKENEGRPGKRKPTYRKKGF